VTCEHCRYVLYYNGFCQTPKECPLKQELTQTQEMIQTLSPEVQQRVEAILSTWAELKFEADLLAAQQKIEEAKIKAELEAWDIKTTDVNGFKLTIVKGESSKFDKLEFVKLGGSLQMLADATRKKPKKPYVLITKAGEKPKTYGEEEE